MLAILFAHAIAAAVAPLLVYRWGRMAFYPLALVPALSLIWVGWNWPDPATSAPFIVGGCPSCR
jgi:multicomponent Na+:H+ antiporter subunit A